MDPQVRARLEEIESTLARVEGEGGEAVFLEEVLANRVWQADSAGTNILAGGVITAPAALTTLGPFGKVKISASMSGSVPATQTARVVIQTAIGAGAFTTLYAFTTYTGAAAAATHFDAAAVIEFDSAQPPGTVIHVQWITTLADGTVTLGNGVTGFGSWLLIEEVL